MNKENTEKLFIKYPAFFKHKDNLRASLMGFGFECSDGWFNLIDNLCNEITKFFNGKISKHFYVTQVKEKFGGLRFYITSAPSEIHEMIAKAEQESFSICEECGKKCVQEGKKYKSFYRDKLPWIRTLCDDCLDIHIRSRYNRERRKNEDFISGWQKKNNAPFKVIKFENNSG